MQYLGGKTRIAKHLANVMLPARGGRRVYLEPFIGGGAVFGEMAPHFERAVGSDACLDLALLWQALLEGWEPPEIVTEEEYRALRHAEPSALRAIVGFGCSFGGKWFGGYARDPAYTERGEPQPYAARAGRRLRKLVAGLPEGTTVVHADYRSWSPHVHESVLVYCDPPYGGTTSYGAVEPFDSDEFWQHVRTWTERGAAVFVSEYDAPGDFVPVWSGTPRKTIQRSNVSAPRAPEHLFVHESAVASLGIERAA